MPPSPNCPTPSDPQDQTVPSLLTAYPLFSPPAILIKPTSLSKVVVILKVLLALVKAPSLTFTEKLAVAFSEPFCTKLTCPAVNWACVKVIALTQALPFHVCKVTFVTTEGL